MTSDDATKDARYLRIILDPIRVSARYKPKFGQGTSAGYNLAQFKTLYQADPFYSWFGLDNPLMYAAHKAAGGMTSVYRQIGIGCEQVFRQVLQDALGISATSANWSYEVVGSNTKKRMLHLDGRVPFAEISDLAARRRFEDWMKSSAAVVGVTNKMFSALTGTVFEVRQGYKSKDSKRQNADIANAATAYIKGYLADRNFKRPSGPRLPTTFVARNQPYVASKLRSRVAGLEIWPPVGFCAEPLAIAGPPSQRAAPPAWRPRRPSLQLRTSGPLPAR